MTSPRIFSASDTRILSASDTGIFRDVSGNPAGSVDLNPKLSSVVTFRIATAQEVQSALRDEEYLGTSPTLSLAKQGLFNDGDSTVFHPNYVKWLGEASGVPNIQTSFKDVEGWYSLSRETFNKVLDVFEKSPSLMWIQ